MRISVRPADLWKDRDLLMKAVADYINPKADTARFEWLYLHNPAGPARAWIATETERGGFVGMACAFPRRVQLSGGKLPAWVLGDFCVSDAYRSLGPALLLQRTIIAASRAERIALFYDFPSTGMMAIYTRLGVAGTSRLVRLARPLRADRHIEKLVLSKGLARLLCPLGNIFLDLTSPRPAAQVDVSLAMLEGTYGSEFSQLADAVGEQSGGCLYRSADYLNWRYGTNPTGRYTTVTARRGSRLVAYATFTQADEDAILVDLFGMDDILVFEQLIAMVLTYLRDRRVMVLSVPIMESHPWFGVFLKLGFKVREDSPIVVGFPESSPLAGMSPADTLRLIMAGDRDC